MIRHWPGNYIATYDDLVDLRLTDIPEHGVEGGEVRVDIVDGGRAYALVFH